MKNTKHLFGPVPSRRFKRSLGVDLTPFKTCTFDCVFCQLGRTTNQTIERREYIRTDEVISEIEEWLAGDGQADYITLSGSGEPTLHSGFGQILEFVKENSKIPTVILTNGTLLYRPEVREAACLSDIVKVSLSAWDQSSYEWVNRPHPKLRFEQLVEGQRSLREQFQGEIWMEVFLINGMNSTQAAVQKIAAIASEIRPDRIHLNTSVRPPAEDFVGVVPRDRLALLADLFHPKAEVIANFSGTPPAGALSNEDGVYAMLKRRPCTADDIVATFGLHINEVLKHLGNLLQKNRIRVIRRRHAVYYDTVKKEPN